MIHTEMITLWVTKPRLPILGMTGLPERKGVKGPESLELTAMLTKPFFGDELLRVLQKTLLPSAKSASPRGCKMSLTNNAWRVLVVSVLLWIQTALPLDSAEVELERLPTLTRAEQVRGLAPADARLGYRIRLVGIVTFSNPGKGLLFVQDASGGVFVVPLAQTWDWPVGRKVEITGVAAEGSHLPFVNQALLQDLGPGTLPKARLVTFARLATNVEDANWVEIRGVVRTATVTKGRLVLEIAAEGKRLRAIFRDVLTSRDEVGALVDAEVRLQGVAGVVSHDPNSLVFLEMHVASLTNLVLEVKTPVQAIGALVHPIASLLPPLAAPALIHRLRVKGTLNRAPDGIWRISDATGAIQVHSTQPLGVSTNASIDVLGFLGGLPDAPMLEDATMFLPSWPQDANRMTDVVPESLLPVLTQAEVVRNLPASEAQQGYPVRIQGVITYADRDWDLLFVQDETSGICIADPTHIFVGNAGQAVVVEGYSGMGPYAPILRQPRFQVLGPDRMPMAQPVTLERLKIGQEDSQRVEVHGIVRYLSMENGHLLLMISTSGGLLKSFIPNFGTNQIPAHLVDAEIQGLGVCDTVVNKERQRIGLRLLMTGLADIRVTKLAPDDPFVLPVQPINRLLQFQSQSDLRHRIHVRGIVTFRDPQWCTLFVQDENSSIYVRTLHSPVLVIGDRVDVVGFVDLESYGLVISEAIFRRIGSESPPLPTAVTIAQAISGEYQSRLVTLEARLVDHVRGTDGRGLLLQGAEWSFTALLESSQNAQRLNTIRKGSLVQLTGICRLEGSDDQAAKALRLQLRTPDDVVVLKKPPRLTTRQWMAVAGLAGLFFVAAVSWVILLRRSVWQRTRALRTLSECNQALVRATDEAELLDHVCRILVDHGGYRMAWVGLAEQDEAKSVRPVAQAGFDAGYLATLKLTWNDTECGRGPTGTAIRTRQPVIAQNLCTDPALALWHQDALRQGCAALAALPLVRDDRVLGAMMVYSVKPGTFEAGEVELLMELASDLAYGITALHTATERKRADEAVRMAHQQLLNIIEFLPDATFVIDQDKRVIAWNQACEVLTGVKKEALLGRGDYAYAEPFFGERRPILIDLLDLPAPEVEATYKNVQRKGDMVFAEAFLPRLKGGRGVHLWAVATLLFDHEGCRCGAIEVIRDITDHKRVESALRESERKYRELVEYANSIILRWNSEGHITFLNEFGLQFFGYSAEEIFGRHVMGTIVPLTDSSGRDLKQLIDRIRTNPKAFEQNVNENMRRNGERVWISWANRVVQDAQGEVIEILSVGTDITERKRAEEAIQELNASLERRVQERTAELAVAKDRAEAADRLKSAFLATMSHELRTPLNSIIGFTGILAQGMAGPLNAEQHKQLEMVRSSARHLLELINDVLDISKIEAGQLEVACESFDLRASLEKVVQIVKPLADKKGLAVRMELAGDVGLVASDKRRVEQVLMNLLNNAVKFTEQGEVVLSAVRKDVAGHDSLPERTVNCGGKDPEKHVLSTAGCLLHITVRDTGIGIKPEDLATLFHPFRQIDSGLSRSHEGTGLGLAICRKLAGLMGGEIRAESEFGKGSEFTFVLPLPPNSP